MILQVILTTILAGLTHGTPIIYNQNFNNHQNAYPPALTRGYLTPPRAITNLHTYVPRTLIPPAPARTNIPRVYETPKPRMYTPPPIFRTIQPAPTTRKAYVQKYVNTTNNNSRYAYNYSVNDNRTGDIKNVEERLENGIVRGSYSLVEPDGITVRRVTYTADDVNGFVANVERTNQPSANNNTPFTIFNP